MPDLCVGVIGDLTSCRDAEAFGLIVFVLGSVLLLVSFSLTAAQTASGPKRNSPP